MAGFFDFSNPDYQRLSGMLAGLSSGFGKAAMPSNLPIGSGAMMGMAAEGGYSGAQAGQKAATDFQNTGMEQASKGIGLDQALMIENLLRSAMGKPAITAKDLQGGMRSPLFGFGNVNPAPAPVTPPSIGGGPADSGSGVPAAAGAAPAEAAQGQGNGPTSAALRSALVNKLLIGTQPTDYQKAKMFADSLPPGPEKLEAQRAAAKLAGINVTANQRAGESTSLYNPETGGFEEAMRNPNLSPDLDYDPKTRTAHPVAGALEGLGQVEDVKQRAKAQYSPLHTYDAAGNEIIQPSTVLKGDGSAPAQPPTLLGYAERVAQLEGSGASNPPPTGTTSAAGADQFLNGTWLEQAKKYLPPQLISGKSDQQLLALRSDPQVSAFLTNKYAADNAPKLSAAGIKTVGAPELYMAHHFGPQGAAAILKAPVNALLSDVLPPKVMQANPDLAGATVGDIYSHTRQAMHGVQLARPSSKAGPQAAPQVPGTPDTPVQHSDLGIPSKLDDFIGKLGPNYVPPSRPAVPAGALMGEPGKGTEEIQKLDGDRLEQYSKEAAGGQKVLTNLQQLYQIMSRGISTGHMTGEATALTNLAQQLGLGRLVPKTFDPNDAAAFNKLATDLVFAQLKQIGGRPMVSEIEGLKQANPNTSLPPAANIEILNNILADQRWRDARADLGRQYMARFGSLGDFDARFNEMYPEVDAYNRVADSASKSGWKLPGSKETPSGRNSKAPDPKVQSQISDASIQATAKKYGHTVDQVKAQLRAGGYQVP